MFILSFVQKVVCKLVSVLRILHYNLIEYVYFWYVRFVYELYILLIFTNFKFICVPSQVNLGGHCLSAHLQCSIPVSQCTYCSGAGSPGLIWSRLTWIVLEPAHLDWFCPGSPGLFWSRHTWIVLEPAHLDRSGASAPGLSWRKRRKAGQFIWIFMMFIIMLGLFYFNYMFGLIQYWIERSTSSSCCTYWIAPRNSSTSYLLISVIAARCDA